MTRFYLSGPISNADPAIVARNKQAFRRAEAAIWNKWPRRAEVANPVRICAGVDDGTLVGDALWLACMRLCLPVLVRCDVVVTLHGYRGSRGARVEVYNARALAMPVHTLAGLLERAA